MKSIKFFHQEFYYTFAQRGRAVPTAPLGYAPKFGHGMKKGHILPLSFITNCNRRLLSSIQTKIFPLNPVLQIDAIIV